MISLITFMAGFYLGVLFFALLAVGRRGKFTGSDHLGRQQRSGKGASRRYHGNSWDLDSLSGQGPLSGLGPVSMVK